MSARRRVWGVVLGGAAATSVALFSGSASACGGFFCSQAAGVNQTAERIVFAKNADETITAVIEIRYQGPSDKFSWLLPISTVPTGDQIAVGSSVALQRLQQATNPQYTLSTRIEGTCDTEPPRGGGFGGTASAGFPGTASGGAATADNGGVTVDAQGVVGAFAWTVISLDQGLDDPAGAAVKWLGDNGYDVPQGAPGLLGPYLADGLHLLALKLQKGATTGSIRPIVLTYAAKQPMIPIKLTAVAASDDMGVMTWVLGDSRAVPQNYNSLELNEARINWFSPNANYNAVVTQAADQAGGQGFVTEFAGNAPQLGSALWTTGDDSTWTSFSTNPSIFGPDPFATAVNLYRSWDGFWDVLRAHATLKPGITIEGLQNYQYSASGAGTLDDSFLAACEKDVIKPMKLLSDLFAAHPKVTRLYSTLSAPEMTVDPLFTLNPTLPDVSNLHTAVRVIECAPGYYTSTAPWHIELPQGDVVRGGPSQVGNWPPEFASQPANRVIVRAAATGPGKVLEDNSAMITAAVTTYNDALTTPGPSSGGSAGSMSAAGAAGSVAASPSGSQGGSAVASAGSGNQQTSAGKSGMMNGVTPAGGGDGCAVDARGRSGSSWLLPVSVGLWLARRRRRRAS